MRFCTFYFQSIGDFGCNMARHCEIIWNPLGGRQLKQHHVNPSILLNVSSCNVLRGDSGHLAPTAFHIGMILQLEEHTPESAHDLGGGAITHDAGKRRLTIGR